MHLSQMSNKSLDFIYGIERSKKRFSLVNLKKFLGKIGNPEKGLKYIHVAGTNGKGSVCSFINQSLISAGYKTGLYTSPHLIKINERIKINNHNIPDKDLDRLAHFIEQQEKKHKIKLTFFETLTVIAFLYFHEQEVSYVVLETGLGGRLDATNVATPVISAITNIGLEHKEVLGDTIQKIAAEKAGIIKKGIPTVTHCTGTALAVIKKRCSKQHSKLIIAKKNPHFFLGLKGNYQIENSETAYTCLKALGIEEKDIQEGFRLARWPGRFEFIDSNILVDCCHNPHGIKALIKSLRQLRYKNLIIIYGAMHDKDTKAIAKEMHGLTKNIIITKAQMSRAAEPEEIAKHFNMSVITHNLKHAVKFARAIAKPGDLILITGSIFLVGEALALFKR